MRETLFTLYMKFQNLMESEEGQDLIEYGLLCTLIALAAIVGMDQVATAVAKMFNNIGASV